MTETTSLSPWRTIDAPVADALAAGLAALLLPALVDRFRQSGASFETLVNGALFAGCYLLFLVGLYLLRRIAGQPLPAIMQRRALAAAALLPLAAGFALAVADLTGFLDTVNSVDFGDIGNSYYYLATPGVYILLGLLAFFLFSVQISADRPAAQLALPTLLLLNIMPIAAAGYLAAVVPTLLVDANRLTIGGLIYLALLLLFTFPRLLYFFRTRQIPALITLDLLFIVLAALATVPR